MVSSPCVYKFGELRFVVRVCDRAGPQSVADRKADVVGGHDLADFIPMGVKETLPMMGEAPLRHDASAARNDAGHAARGHRNVAQKHSRMDRKIIHTLLGLFD